MFDKARLYIAITVAFSLGWFSHGLVSKSPSEPTANHPSSPALSDSARIHPKLINAPTPPPAEERMANVPAIPQYKTDSQKQLGAEGQSKTKAEELLNKFTALLHQHKFDAAMNLYLEQGTELAVKEQQSWRAVVIDFLSRRLDNGETELFSELAGMWLQFNYSDIDVLLLVAQYNRVLGYHGEALQTYIQAYAHAHSSFAQNKVHSDLQDFIFAREKDWMNRNKWHELTGFFAQLDELDLATHTQQFRYAELLLMQQNEQVGYLVLDELAQINAGWRQRVEELKAQYEKDGEYALSASNSPAFQSAITMKPAKGHYLIDVGINRENQATLLLDTGATITMITVETFSRMVSSTGWQDHGWAMFNTANGLVRGRIVQVDQLQFGGYSLENVRLAVQTADLGEGVHGLLGMNVLSKFHFQIDQDNHKLRLTPRE